MSASKAQRAKTAERRAKALSLRQAGVKLDQIVQQLGYADRASASKDITRALDGSLREQKTAADELRALELSRLDRLQQALWSAALGGDHRAVKTILDILDRRAKYLALDKQSSSGDYAVSVLGQLAAGLGIADSRLAATGAYRDLPVPDGIEPVAPAGDGYEPPDDGYQPPADVSP